jgi:phosphoribosylanthranilate isomerase
MSGRGNPIPIPPAGTQVQIAGLSRLDDVRFAFAAGADAVGFTVGLPGGPHDGLTEEGVGEIVASLPPFQPTVLITYEASLDGLLTLLAICRTPILQAHGAHHPDVLRALRGRMPHLKVLKSVSVVDEGAIEEAKRWEGIADALILDSVDPATGRLGATGRTHDWGISRRIVAGARMPVILAGGLTPGNVSAAIAEVRPWGVDVHTGIEVEGVLDRELLLGFVAAAKGADVPSAGHPSWGRGPGR